MTKRLGLMGLAVLAVSVMLVMSQLSYRTIASAADVNLVPNPGLEISSGGSPTSWSTLTGGGNTVRFNYLSSGAHSGTRAVSVNVSRYGSGNIGWTHASQPVTPGTTYTVRDWYKSTASSRLIVTLTMANGSSQAVTLTTLSSRSNWTQVSVDYTIPSGVARAGFSHVLRTTGTLTTDDYSAVAAPVTPTSSSTTTTSTTTTATSPTTTPPNSTTFARPIVTLTYDDGPANQYTDARPLMNSYGYKGTYYIITNTLPSQANSMSIDQIRTLYAEGNEIGSHTVSHPDLTKLTAANLDAELRNSQATLVNYLGVPIANVASPYGAYNATTTAAVKQFYRSQRNTWSGYNPKSNTDIYNIKMMSITNNITAAQVQGWINEAIRTNSWLVILMHQVTNDPAAGTYSTTPAVLNSTLSYLQTKNVSVQTVNQALDELVPQLAR